MQGHRELSKQAAIHVRRWRLGVAVLLSYVHVLWRSIYFGRNPYIGRLVAWDSLQALQSACCLRHEHWRWQTCPIATLQACAAQHLDVENEVQCLLS